MNEPHAFKELLALLPRLRGVRFTGHTRPTLDLDELAGPKRRRWARKTWQALQELSAYAQAKEAGARGSLSEHLRDRATLLPLSRLAPHESRTVRQKSTWAPQRLFPVPLDVNPEGRVLMLSHICIDSRGVAPRLYYLDRTGHGQGVLVGRIGRHLTNTMS